jgi:hypothetical protein
LIIREQSEPVELRGARSFAAVHLRDKNAVRTICGRDAGEARILDRLVGVDFDPTDPDVRVCRSCLALAGSNTQPA